VVRDSGMKGGRVIIVSGTPGTGKTRFSRLLARKLDIDSIDMTRFAKQRNLIKSYDRRRRTYVVDEGRLRRELKRYLTNLKKKALVEGHYADSVVPTRLVDAVFVLRCDPRVLKDRLKRRGYPQAKIRENVEAEILDICLNEAVATHGLEKVAEIDTSTGTTDDLVEEALLVLTKKKIRRIGAYDWLAMLERTGRLDEFLQERTMPWRKRSS